MSRRPAIARGARINVALMALLAVAFLTGWLAFALATAPARWSLLVHAVGGFAISFNGSVGSAIKRSWSSTVPSRRRSESTMNSCRKSFGLLVRS